MKSIKEIIQKLLPEWFKKILRRVRLELQLYSAIDSMIVKADEAGEIVKTIKEESIEKVIIPAIYEFIAGGVIDFKSPKLDLMKYTDAMIFSDSDFILCEKGTVWEKFHVPQFTKIIPADKDLLKRIDSRIFIKKPENIINVKIGFSLCGVHSNAWSHFVVQYLPKIYMINEIIQTTNQTVAVILPNNTDPHIRELVADYKEKTSNLEIVELKNNEVAKCDILYHVGNTAWLSEHINDIGPADGVIPEFVADSMKNNLSDYFSTIDNEVRDSKNNTPNKLFIARDIVRNISNYNEVEEYFKQMGYFVVKPHGISLLEKIRLFRNASLIVGPVSGGFTNLFFCRKGTKVLVLSSYQRCIDTYLGFFSEYFDINTTVVVGCDIHQNDLNSSFVIPFDKIKNACEEFGF